MSKVRRTLAHCIKFIKRQLRSAHPAAVCISPAVSLARPIVGRKFQSRVSAGLAAARCELTPTCVTRFFCLTTPLTFRVTCGVRGTNWKSLSNGLHSDFIFGRSHVRISVLTYRFTLLYAVSSHFSNSSTSINYPTIGARF
jgi:hypothetical protein